MGVRLLPAFCAVGALFGGSGEAEKARASDGVKTCAGQIQPCAAEHGIPEYTEPVMTVMMHESRGQGNEPMQASRRTFIAKYSGKHKRHRVLRNSVFFLKKIFYVQTFLFEIRLCK